MPSTIQAIAFLDLPGLSFESIWILLGVLRSKRRSVPSSKPQNHTHVKSRKIKVNQVYSHQTLTNYRTLSNSLALAPCTLILPHIPCHSCSPYPTCLSCVPLHTLTHLPGCALLLLPFTPPCSPGSHTALLPHPHPPARLHAIHPTPPQHCHLSIDGYN